MTASKTIALPLMAAALSATFAVPTFAAPAAPSGKVPVATQSSDATQVQWRRGYRGGYYRDGYHRRGGYWRNGRWIAPLIGGAVIGGAIAGANRDYAGGGGDGAYERCAEQFRSFDPATGTYTTYDGRTVVCPYLL